MYNSKFSLKRIPEGSFTEGQSLLLFIGRGVAIRFGGQPWTLIGRRSLGKQVLKMGESSEEHCTKMIQHPQLFFKAFLSVIISPLTIFVQPSFADDFLMLLWFQFRQ